MDIHDAKEISEVLGGEIRQVDDEKWLVLIERSDGRIVALSDDSVEEYADLEALEAGRCYCCISLK